MPYIGNSPGTGTRNRFIYTATASQTTFSGADDNGKTLKYSDGDYVDVYLNGICLVPVDDYAATSKTSIVLTVGAAVGDTLEVVAYDIATIADTVSKANGGTFESTVTFNDGIVPTTGGTNNVSIGTNALDALDASSPGGSNVAIGTDALGANTTGTQSIAIGYRAGQSQTTNGANTFVGNDAGRDTTGTQNAFYGHDSGRLITTGQKNTVIGSFDGNQDSLDIRTLSGNVVLSDGDGNVRGYYNNADSEWQRGIGSGNYVHLGTSGMNALNSIAFDDIPSWATEIILAWTDPYINSSNNTMRVQLRSGGSNIGSGYESYGKRFGGSSLTTEAKLTTSLWAFTSSNTLSLTGQARLVRAYVGSTSAWTYTCLCGSIDNDTTLLSFGEWQGTSTIDGVRLFTDPGNTWSGSGYLSCYVKGESV